MEDKNQGVTLILARHDNARSQDITAYGAAYAYLMGKFLCDVVESPYPEHIFYSPVARTRNTAKMHQLAMKLNDIYIPTMSYDAGFHENTSEKKMLQSLDDALLYAKSQNMKTIEIVGHEPTVLKCMKKFPKVPSEYNKLGYGGCFVLKADSWDDLMQGKLTEMRHCKGSKELAQYVLGDEQAELLDDLMYQGQTSGQINIRDLGERSKKQIQKAYKWIDAKEAGQETPEKYSPAEFLEILDAYKFWASQSMTAVGIAPDKKSPFHSNMQQLLFGQDSYFNQKFLAEFNQRSNEQMDDSDSTMPHPVFDAVSKMLAQKMGVSDKLNVENEQIAEQMEDFPLYRDIISAGEERHVEGDEEVKTLSKASYRVTKKEQQMHDQIADVVRKFKGIQR